MDDKIYRVIEEAILTAPMLLSVGEFDTEDEDIVELVTEQRNASKKNPDNLIPTIEFIFENGYIDYEYLTAILKNASLTQDDLFYLLLLFIKAERGGIHKEDTPIFEIGSKHPKFDSSKFEWFLIKRISSHPIHVAKNILSTRKVLKQLALQKGADCIALEAAIFNPNMDFEILDILAESFYLARRDSVIRSVKRQMNNGAENAKDHFGVDDATSQVMSLLFLQSGFACASVHLELMKKTQEVAEKFMWSYNVQYEE